MAEHTIPELDARGLRKFAYTTGGLLALIFGLLIPWTWDLDYPRWPWVIAGILFVWGTAAPKTLRGVYRLWMQFGLLLNKVTTPIILGTVFALLIVPYAAGLKLLGRDPMRRKLEKSEASYRIKTAASKQGHMKRPF